MNFESIESYSVQSIEMCEAMSPIEVTGCYLDMVKIVIMDFGIFPYSFPKFPFVQEVCFICENSGM
jgi:hypothetical protein